MQQRDQDPAEFAAREKGRKTEDRLQAFSDPRDFAESEAVVDLDELDIFDDLDEYVDLDKVEVIQDVQLNDKGEEENSQRRRFVILIEGAGAAIAIRETTGLMPMIRRRSGPGEQARLPRATEGRPAGGGWALDTRRARSRAARPGKRPRRCTQCASDSEA